MPAPGHSSKNRQQPTAAAMAPCRPLATAPRGSAPAALAPDGAELAHYQTAKLRTRSQHSLGREAWHWRSFLSLYTQKVQKSPQALMAQEQALLARLLPGTLKSMSPRQLYICTFPTYPKSLRVAALSWIIPDTCVSGMTRTET